MKLYFLVLERIFMGRSHVARVAEARVEQINRYCQVYTYAHTGFWLTASSPSQTSLNIYGSLCGWLVFSPLRTCFPCCTSHTLSYQLYTAWIPQAHWNKNTALTFSCTMPSTPNHGRKASSCSVKKRCWTWALCVQQFQAKGSRGQEGHTIYLYRQHSGCRALDRTLYKEKT